MKMNFLIMYQIVNKENNLMHLHKGGDKLKIIISNCKIFNNHHNYLAKISNKFSNKMSKFNHNKLVKFWKIIF
jgi:hypothetical protein